MKKVPYKHSYTIKIKDYNTKMLHDIEITIQSLWKHHRAPSNMRAAKDMARAEFIEDMGFKGTKFNIAVVGIKPDAEKFKY